ncbi:unnamed protein product, partial [Mesorhabditis belari]|uniref:C-type lectin domain-containing protein n=1 Tax=Mesorhabditis belari TaxID=2138241 RepID=A0AAF3ETC1_9BILA
MAFTKSLLLFALVSIVQCFECPNGSQPMPNEDVCMYAINQNEFYYDVIRRCGALGAIPAKIQNLYENSYLFVALQQELNNAAPFIGVERKRNNVWTYADGTPLSYQNWALNEPNNSSNSSVCAIMDPSSGKWISTECTYARPFVCSIDGDAAQCPTGWVYNNQTNFCYYVQDFTFQDGAHWFYYTFTGAEQNCQRKKAHLVSIHTPEEDTFVRQLVTSDIRNATDANPCANQYAWIGLTGTGALGVGTWIDGSPVDYSGHATVGNSNWGIGSDAGCSVSGWNPMGTGARYVCKMAAKGKATAKLD